MFSIRNLRFSINLSERVTCNLTDYNTPLALYGEFGLPYYSCKPAEWLSMMTRTIGYAMVAQERPRLSAGTR